MISENCAKEKLSIRNFFQYIKYKTNFAKQHVNYFYPCGLVAFVGPQGSGKTLSAVNYVYKLLEMYPTSKLVTNINLKDYPIVTFEQWKEHNKPYIIGDLSDSELYNIYININRVFPFNNNDDLTFYKNTERGVIFLIDEIQLYLNSLESKNVNLEVMNVLSQQRKQRIHVVCTSQVFGRMAKPVREQFSNVMLCKNILGCVQHNKLIDRDSIENVGDSSQVTGEVLKNFLWIHSPKMYARYDTSYVIDKNKFIDGKGENIYGRND